MFVLFFLSAGTGWLVLIDRLDEVVCSTAVPHGIRCTVYGTVLLFFRDLPAWEPACNASVDMRFSG